VGAPGHGDAAGTDRRLREQFQHALGPGQDLPAALDTLARVGRELLGCRSVAIRIAGADGRVEYESGSGTAPQGDETAAMTMTVAVVVRGEPVGTLLITGPGPSGGDDPVDHRSAEILAFTVAEAVERQRTTEQNRRRERWYTRGSQLARDVAASRHADAMHAVTGQIADIAEADRVVLLRAQGAGVEDAPEAAELLAGSGGDADPGAVLRSARPARWHSRGRSVLLVPLVASHGPLGVLVLVREGHRPPFTAADMGMATMLAGQVALAVELAEVQNHRDQIRLLEERDRIARDLHDNVIQRLFAVGMTLQHSGARLPESDADAVRSSVDEIDDAIRQIRATIYRLTGAITAARLSLRGRVDDLVDDMQPLLGFRPRVVVTGPVDLGVGDEEIVDDALAVLREALTNVARHAGARRVDVMIALDASGLTVAVTDDGRGIGETNRRSGLANIQTRARRHGGRLVVDTSPERGTRLRWTVPLDLVDSPPPEESAGER